MYGDADPLDLTQWSRVTHSIPADMRTWSEKTSTCSNMFNGEFESVVSERGMVGVENRK